MADCPIEELLNDIGPLGFTTMATQLQFSMVAHTW